MTGREEIKTLKSSKRALKQSTLLELGLLFVIVIVAILLYTSLIFAIESEGPEAEHWSFYDSFWC